MSDNHEKIAIIQHWLDDFSQTDTINSETDALKESLLDGVVSLIEQNMPTISLEKSLSETYTDFEKQMADQIATLNQATEDLKSQITQRKRSSLKLQQAYNNLETRLKEHISNHLKVNKNLQEQILEYRQLQVVEKEERLFTEALRSTLTTLSSTHDLDKILDHILNTVGQVTAYDGANVLLVESELVRVVRQRGYAEDGKEKDWLNQRIPMMKLAVLQQLIDIGKPLAISHTDASPMWIGFPNLQWVNSNVIAPIRANGKILGFLSLDSATPGFFTQLHADRLQAFADQAAIAIQNARLLDRTKRSAMMAERTRLANELHDTISQTLWSMSLITERLPILWDINQEEARQSLKILHQLTKNALEEMRSLLLELHPSTLNSAKLGDLIRQIATIITNRTGLAINVHIKKQDTVPEDVHFALYRVTQEALNNIILHASATLVEINFNSYDGNVELSIKDNGRGFNPDNIPYGHFGLIIMRERVQNIGGTIQIVSSKGEATLIKIICYAGESLPK